MKNLKPILTFLLVVAALAACTVGSDRGEVEKQSELAAERNALLQELTAFANAHNAELEWRKHLPDLETTVLLFSIDLENALTLPDAKPVMFIASLEDARKIGAEYYLIFRSNLQWNDLRFELKCPADQVEKILDDRPDIFNVYAVVAEVRSVTKLSTIESDEYGVSYSSNDLFRVNGRLISFKRLGNEALSLRFDRGIETLLPN